MTIYAKILIEPDPDLRFNALIVQGSQYMLTLTSSSLRGMVGQKRISCTIRMSSPGLKIPAGNYALLPGPGNPIHGPMLLLVPTDEKTARDLETKSPELLKSFYKLDSSQAKVYPKVEARSQANVYPKVEARSQANVYPKVEARSYEKWQPQTGERIQHKVTQTLGVQGGLPVAGKSISGSQSLIVDHGFSDLLETVASSGGIGIRIP
jgi:hypothetical protein